MVGLLPVSTHLVTLLTLSSAPLWALDMSQGAALPAREGRNMLSWLLIKPVELQSALS